MVWFEGAEQVVWVKVGWCVGKSTTKVMCG